MNTTLSWTIEAIDLAAKAAGYIDAADALIDLTGEPFEPFGARAGGMLLATYAELTHSEGETKEWAGRGMYVTDGNRKTEAPYVTNAETNRHRRPHPEVENLRAFRAAGLTAAEQARVLNFQRGTDYWTAQRIRAVAHQQGLTSTPAKRGRAVAGRG